MKPKTLKFSFLNAVKWVKNEMKNGWLNEGILGWLKFAQITDLGDWGETQTDFNFLGKKSWQATIVCGFI